MRTSSLGSVAAIAGIGQTEFSKDSGRGEMRLALEAIHAALDDAGLRPEDVDGMSTYTMENNPEIEVNHRGRRMKLRARLAAAEEKADLWPVCDEHYAPYAEYRARTTRDIPIFVCEPAA